MFLTSFLVAFIATPSQASCSSTQIRAVAVICFGWVIQPYNRAAPVLGIPTRRIQTVSYYHNTILHRFWSQNVPKSRFFPVQKGDRVKAFRNACNPKSTHLVAYGDLYSPKFKDPYNPKSIHQGVVITQNRCLEDDYSPKSMHLGCLDFRIDAPLGDYKSRCTQG